MFVVRWLFALVSPSFVLVLLLAAIASGCAIAPEDGTIDNVFDPCQWLTVESEAGTTAPEDVAVEAAIALWNDRADTKLSVVRAEGAPILPVRFDPAALAFRGLYDDENAVVFVNSRMDDPEALSVTLAHELGHAFGLTHVEPEERASLMNPGNLHVGPTDADAAALAELWGACDADGN